MDANTVWTVAYGFLTLTLTGLAVIAYRHPAHYREFFTHGVFFVGWMFVWSLMNNQLVENLVQKVYPFMKPGSEPKLQAVIDDLAVPYPMQGLLILAAIALVVLRFIPNARD